MVWIVVVNYFGAEDTRKCLRSLAAVMAGTNVVVVDNASEPDPIQMLLDEFPWIHTVRNDSNLGWSGGNNAGIRYALNQGAERVVLLNNDTVVDGTLIERLLSAFEAYPQFGVLGPMIRYMDNPELVMTDGVTFNLPQSIGFFDRRPVEETVTEPPTVVRTDVVNGCCMAIRASLFREIGPIDDRYFLVHEESDFCLRAEKAGWHSGVLAESHVWHKGSASFKRSSQKWQRYYDIRNLALLLRNHYSVNGRRFLESFGSYLRYAYYCYCHERDLGNKEAADGVLEGIADAMTVRCGPYLDRRRLAVPLLRGLLAFMRLAKAKPHSNDVSGLG